MEKIIFADKTEFELLPGASLGENKVIVPDFADLKAVAEALAKAGNLDAVQYKSNEQVTGEYADMTLEAPLFKAAEYTDEKKVVATFAIREKTETEKRLDKIEREQDTLKKGQAVQDGAILDLAGMVGGEA
nr:hypothetical protein [uncultured Blautia sp.]